jgi:phage baseplate assembly protein W
MQIDFPYHVDPRMRTAETSEEDHIRDLIEQVLFTNPGERVNRPSFGAGLDQLVFGPAASAMVTTVQTLAQGALQQWLSDRVRVEGVEVTVEEATLRITVQYSLVRNQERRVVVLERGGSV